MSNNRLGMSCVVLIVLLGGGIRALAEFDGGIPPWEVEPRSGEDRLVVRRNAFLNEMAKGRNGRVTIVKFDDDSENRCPILTSLLFSAGGRREWLTPEFNLEHSSPPTT